MSLLSMPFVDTNVDTVLSVFAGVVLIATVAAVAIGFWKIHELPIHKASTKEHHQIGLITALTWIGFVWHWVWVLAVIIAFVDGEQALRRLRDIWHGDRIPASVVESTNTEEK
ncbi:MFS transporter [Photobacterium aquimaris]|uniref:MFS transporter n=1 Tax=Photobacterium TaxID=657 RepID=UPI0007F0116B|nr:MULTISPECIES: MFS transporter [Photobacterium]OBU18011.1 MFS transporter [Photobacterium aquimaris]PSW00371.1 MFS transporter [Photobacterium aquimaris]